MYWDEHNPPHFHAEYGEFIIQITINDGKILAGKIPSRALKLINEWRELYKEELLKNWEHSKNNQPFEKIEPLK